MRRLLTAIVFVWLGLSVSTALAADARMIVRGAMLDEYPRVTLQLALPDSGKRGGAEPQFTVSENGRSVEVLSAKKITADPVDVILVLDTSGSMKGQSLAAAKQAALAFIRELQPGSRVGIVSFASRPAVIAPVAVGNESLLAPSVNGLVADGETSLYDGLSLAAKEASRADVKRPVVVLLSDGGDTVSRTKLDSAIKDLRVAKAPVLVVALPSAEADFGILRTVAGQTGGRFASIKSADSLVRVYQGLARQLQVGWRLTYVSRRPSTKDLDVAISATRGDGTAAGSLVLPNPLFAGEAADAGSALSPIPPANVITLLGAVSLVFISMFAFVAVIALFLIKPKTALDTLKYYDQLQGTAEGGDVAEDYSGRVTSSLLGAVDYVAGKRGLKRFIYDQLDRAGLPLRPTEYITIHLLAVIVAGAVTQMLSRNLLVSVLVIVAAALLPMMLLDVQIGRRTRAFEQQLPDVLNLIAGSLRAGWGLQQSVDLVVEQMSSPVSTEFARAQTEIRLGRPVEEALESVAQRTRSVDFSWAVAAIGIQRDVGGNLAEVLDVVAATIRDRMALKRQIAALTAEGRLSAWVLFLLPFLLVGLLLVVNAQYLLKLFTTGPGLTMFAVGVVLLIIGAVWLRRVVTIEV